MRYLTLNKLPLFLGGILLACLPLSQFAGNARLGLGSLAAVFILVSFLAAGWELIKYKQIIGWQLHKIDLAVIGLIGASFISVFTSYFGQASLAGFIKYFFYFLVYLAFRLIIRHRADWQFLVCSALLGAFWLLCVCLKQSFFGVDALATWDDPNLAPGQKMNRIYGTLLNPNLLSIYLLALWPLCMLTLPKFIKQKSWLLLGLNICVIGIFWYCLFKTGSRAAWISLACQWGLIFGLILFIYRNPLLFGVLGFGLASSIAYLTTQTSFLSRLTSIFTLHGHSSNSFRLHVWQACLRILQDNWLFGIGSGSKSFYLAYGIFMDANYNALGAYSLPLEITVEMGIIGLGALIALLVTIVWSSSQSLQITDKTNSQALLILAILISLSGMLIDSFFDIVILRPQVQIILWLLIAILCYQTQSAAQNQA